eukprot:TRINITY_DN58276_c0_g1_i3.p1 TRINITY_DN58276_c0_g1~~TRINITY_DN58276_c0_g1_i3.p1  ORF type:complete len:105 (-),score=15.31 TRINITY_DN58276_c0_g1_i3:31-345(-)
MDEGDALLLVDENQQLYFYRIACLTKIDCTVTPHEKGPGELYTRIPDESLKSRFKKLGAMEDAQRDEYNWADWASIAKLVKELNPSGNAAEFPWGTCEWGDGVF